MDANDNDLMYDMPRERLMRLGARALADYELLALLMRTGGKGESVLEFSRRILRERNGLVGLLTSNKTQLQPIKGLGEAKTAEILAVAELARRYTEAEVMQHKVQFTTPDSVRDFLLMHFKGYALEEVGVLLLDSQHRLLAFERFSDETPAKAHLPLRRVLASVLHYHAAAAILVHNHPAGDIEPSRADWEITQNADKVLQAVDTALLDHFIVCGNHIISMRENGSW